MREAVVEDEVCKAAEKAGWLVRKMNFTGRRGCPDRFFWRKGVLLMIEFKRPGKEPDGIQTREHNRLRDHGFKVHVIDRIEDGLALIA